MFIEILKEKKKVLDEHIKNDLVVLILIYIISLAPVWIVWGLWAWLDPSTFWEKIVMVLICLCLTPFQIGGVILILIVTNEYLKELKLQRLKKISK